MSVKKIAKNIICMISLPLIVYVLLRYICLEADARGLAAGANGFGVGSDLVVMLRNAVTTGCIALAVSYNLTSGRFDFSVGATLVLACIISGRLVLMLGVTGFSASILLLLFTIVIGMALGAFNGGVYVALHLPPMIASLGVCMLYEAIGYISSGGAGVSVIGRKDLTVWAFSPHIYILLAIILGVLYVLLNRTRFGYATRSLRSGQEVAVNTGINEKSNALVCYAIAGALLGVAGILNMSVFGKTDPKIGLSSISYVQNAFLPMFIGGALEKYGDRNTGVIMGAIVQAEIIAAFGRLGISSSMQSILSGMIVILFFVYSGNVYKLEEMKLFNAKKQRALATMNDDTRLSQ